MYLGLKYIRQGALMKKIKLLDCTLRDGAI